MSPLPTIREEAHGFYSFSLAIATDDDVIATIDAGASLSPSERYIFLDVPAGGYPDTIKASVDTLVGEHDGTVITVERNG